MKKKLLVRKIKEGSVIDHIKVGNGPRVLELLGIEPGHQEHTVVLLMNVKSGKLGRKDIVKIKDRKINEREANKISLVAPNATLNLINDYEVTKKEKVKLPEEFVGIIECPNPDCITQNKKENITSKFNLKNKRPVKLRCQYCERTFSLPELL